ncbi:MAG: COX15/CtaA family protein [Pseudomonadota bacterium]
MAAIDITGSETAVQANAGATSEKAAQRIAIWLLFMCGLVAAMVIVGGATRLTDSGLSITEWKPVTGAIPPLSEAAWLVEFEKYKTIPEYEFVNYGMSLDAFKVIYWWEWGHRQLGRLIGVAFFIPLVFFLATGAVTRGLGVKLGGLFILGGLQGALGWFMVQSGLADRVDVSQYRLAAHLGLAIILFGLMLWLALDLRGKRAAPMAPQLFAPSVVIAGLVFAQIILGAFVAGLRAGFTFNTWPLMDGRFFPAGYFVGAPGLNDMFETIAAVQFNHRIGAYIVTAAGLWLYVKARSTALEPRARILAIAILGQVCLGIWTVVAATPLSLGLLHQAGALVVFSAALYTAHGAAPRTRSEPALVA